MGRIVDALAPALLILAITLGPGGCVYLVNMSDAALTAAKNCKPEPRP